MNTVLLILVGLLAAVGLGCALSALQRWVLRPRKPSQVAVVVPVLGTRDDIELVLRSARSRLLPDAPGSALIIADFGADPGTLQICRMFCGSCPGARICDGRDLPTVLRAYAAEK